MNIMYLHGFGSNFDPESNKVKMLSTIGNVSGIDIDYTESYDLIVRQIINAIIDNDSDLIVGTSLGGYFANAVGVKSGIPFVMINPAVDPKNQLKKYVGSGIDFTGKKYTLTKDTINGYAPALKDPCGILLLDEGDEVIDSAETVKYFKGAYYTTGFAGGSHRFDHMEDSLFIISSFYNTNSCVFGTE